jgi:hypothetical protein
MERIEMQNGVVITGNVDGSMKGLTNSFLTLGRACGKTAGVFNKTFYPYVSKGPICFKHKARALRYDKEENRKAWLSRIRKVMKKANHYKWVSQLYER